MKRTQVLLGSAALVLSVAACDGLREAFTAHVDTVARAEGQELSTDRVATLVGKSQIPVNKDVLTVVSDFWVSYQLLGHAGAHGDALNDSLTKNWWVKDTKAIDDAMWASLLTTKTQRFYDQVSKTFPAADTTGLDQKYAQGNLLAAQHILFMMPERGAGMSKQKQDSVRARAEDVLKKTNSGNFNAMAKQYTEENGSKETFGQLPVFPLGPKQGAMLPEFEAAVKALQPGEVGKTLVQTQYGFHIVRRNLLPEVRSKFVEKLTEDNVVTQQNAFIAKLRSDWKVEARPGAVAKIRDVAKQPMNARGDKTALYTSRMGDFTAARLAQWLDVIPPQAGIRERLASPQMPDSMVLNLVRSLVDQEVLGAEADKQGIKVDTLEVKQIRSYFGRMVKSAMMGLRVDPSLLADSAKTDGEKEKVAAARVDDALDAIFASNGQGMVEITPQVASALRSRYSFRVNSAGVDRAVERAMAIRASADSARAKEMPPAGSGAGLPPGAVPVPVPPGVRGRGGR